MNAISSVLWALLADPPVNQAAPTKTDWPMVAVFVGLTVGVVLIGIFMTWQLRRVHRNADEGVYDGGPSERIS